MSRRSELEREAADVGLHVRTWSPGDGVTRYRFFTNPDNTYFGPENGIFTAPIPRTEKKGRRVNNVNDFVSVEASSVPRMWDLCLWTQDGEKIVLLTETAASANRMQKHICNALSTWDGWVQAGAECCVTE